jgi:5-methylcytosine-specific restriction endonuclease McrA
MPKGIPGSSPACEVEGCRKPSRSLGKCNAHYQHERSHLPEWGERKREYDRKWREANPEQSAESDRKYRESNPEKCRATALNVGHRRRVREAGGEVDESLDVLTVFEEDNYVCQICGKPIDPFLRNRHPMMVTIDHIIPVVKGGSHTRDNVQTAHYRCNAAKDNYYRPI